MHDPTPGEILAVTFRDHAATGRNEPPVYTVWGRCAEVSEHSILLDCWGHADPREPRDPDDQNIESFALVRAAITLIVPLRADTADAAQWRADTSEYCWDEATNTFVRAPDLPPGTVVQVARPYAGPTFDELMQARDKLLDGPTLSDRGLGDVPCEDHVE